MAMLVSLCVVQVRQQINVEYEHVKDLMNILSSFKADPSAGGSGGSDRSAVGGGGGHVHRVRPHAAPAPQHEEPADTYDPDVWPAPDK